MFRIEADVMIGKEDIDEGFMKLIWSVTVLLDVSLNFIKQSRGWLF